MWRVAMGGIVLYFSKYIVVHKDLGYRAFFPVLQFINILGNPLGVSRTVQCSSPCR